MGKGKLFAFDFSTKGGDEMPNGTDNLVPLSERTKEEQREIARKGGRASGKARRKKRALKEAMQAVSQMSAAELGTVDELIRQFNLPENDQTNTMLLCCKMMQLALNGDIKAAQFIVELSGESPKFAVYEKRLELLELQSGGDTKSIIEDWVSSIPETPDILNT